MRKKQTETNILAARQAILHAAKAQSNNQQMNQQIMLNQSANSRMLPTASSQATQLQSQQLTTIQQQQLLSKHSPVTTTVTSLSNHPNYMNTVINNQSLAPAHQQQQSQQAQQLSNKQSLAISRKRPLDRSSPQMGPQMTVQSSMPQQYNGILPNYKTPMTSYTPAVSSEFAFACDRFSIKAKGVSNFENQIFLTAMPLFHRRFRTGIATTSQQAFFPQSRPLSIPVSQQSMSSGQLNFDTKSHPYLSLAGGLPSDSSLTPEQHANLINSAAAQFSQQQLSQLQQELYYQHLIKSSNMPGNLQSSSLMSMQNAPMKAGITTGYPIVQRPGTSSNPPSTSANNANSNSAARFPGRYIDRKSVV